MTLSLLRHVTRFGDDICITIEATVTRIAEPGGCGWVVEDLQARDDDGPIVLTAGERERFTDDLVWEADRA